MEYTKLGHSGIDISRVCVGGMSFGAPDPNHHVWTLGPEDTEAVIKRAVEGGINYIDTANGYGLGTSEEYIGRALKNLGISRDEIVLQSKVFFNEGGLSREAINREIEKTLNRLGTDYLDVYMIHRFDYNTPMEETMEALDNLVHEGKVRALGASEMYAYQLHNMQDIARENGWTLFTNMQCHHNLLYRENEREMIPVCRQFDMAITPYSPLASGHLTRRTWDSDSLCSKTDAVMASKYDREKELDMPIIEHVAELADRRGVPMSQIAIAWLLNRGIESPTIGFSKPERVDDVIAAVDLKLAEDEMDFLEEPYIAHELVGPSARPGEKALAGSAPIKAKTA